VNLPKIVIDSKKRYGEVRNPIGFSSADLLELLGKCRNSGRNYDHISEWLNVMTATTSRTHASAIFCHKMNSTAERTGQLNSQQLVYRCSLRPLASRVIRLERLDRFLQLCRIMRVLVPTNAKIICCFGSRIAL